MDDLQRRAAFHAALGDPVRLAIVDELTSSDRSPSELAARLGLSASLLTFHLDVLEDAGVLRRSRSSGDARRRYVRLVRRVSSDHSPGSQVHGPIVFVCTHNSARSQIAAAMWRAVTGQAASSAGTNPSRAVHPGAVRAAARVGLDLSDARPTLYRARHGRHVVTVCDRAHEELDGPGWHWSVPDPAVSGTDEAFDVVVDELSSRIRSLRPLVAPEAP